MRTIEEYHLNNIEVKEIDQLLKEITKKYSFHEDERFIDQVWKYTRRLPESLLEFLYYFKKNEDNYGVCVIKGYPISKDYAPTPKIQQKQTENSPAKKEKFLLIMITSVLGEPIGWDCQWSGDLINDIIPVAGDENKQINSSSKSELTWHTEEAFHPHRADYVGFFCIRNDEKVPTMFGSIGNFEFSEEIKNSLFQQKFAFLPEIIFPRPNWNKPKPAAVLFGDRESPYLRIDPEYMEVSTTDSEAKNALECIVKQINNKLDEYVFSAGDLCIADNYRTVHGRRAFTPSFSGNDRWLLRINIVRDLRPSREWRKAADSRVICTD